MGQTCCLLKQKKTNEIRSRKAPRRDHEMSCLLGEQINQADKCLALVNGLLVKLRQAARLRNTALNQSCFFFIFLSFSYDIRKCSLPSNIQTIK